MSHVVGNERELPTEALEAQAVVRHLLAQPFYKNAQRVGCYLSMAHGELRTTQIVDDLLNSGEHGLMLDDQRSHG